MRLGVAVLLALGVSVSVLTLSEAPAGATTRGCSAPVYSSDGHKVSLTCTSGRGGQFQIHIRAGNVDGSVTKTSSWVGYGSTARIDAGNYFVVKSSLVIYHNSPTCAYTVLGGATHWCDIQANIQEWANRGNILYTDLGGTWKSNWYGDHTYRPDCSGLVDMAWHLKADPDTDDLATSTYTTGISRSSLRAGDILDDIKSSDHRDHHVIIFAGWNSNHDAGTTNGTFSYWSFGWGTFKDDQVYWHHMSNGSFSASTIAGKTTSDYIARRYVNFS